MNSKTSDEAKQKMESRQGSDFTEIMADWDRRIGKHVNAHLIAADQNNKYHYWVGLPATVLTTLAGSALLSDSTIESSRVIVGIVTLVAAALMAIQTFYSFSKRAELHRAVAMQFKQVGRELLIYQKYSPRSKEEQKRIMEEISSRISEIEASAPIVSISVYKMLKKRKDLDDLLTNMMRRLLP